MYEKTQPTLKFTILVDLDDVMENLCQVWIQCLNERHKTNVAIDDIKEWNIAAAFPSLSKEDIIAPLRTEELWQRVHPLPGAVEYLKRLISDGHTVFVVTASHIDSIKTKFDNVLFKYFPFFTADDVIITSRKQLILGDILIDDAPHNLEGGKYRGILMDAPHNREYDAAANGFIRVKNWKEIYEAVCNLQTTWLGKEKNG